MKFFKRSKSEKRSQSLLEFDVNNPKDFITPPYKSNTWGKQRGTFINGMNKNDFPTRNGNFIQPYITDDGFFMAPPIDLLINEKLLFPWEHSVAQARASVMLYNNDIKKWEHAGGSQGISRVHIYFNPKTDSYRIVGRKVNDNEVVINCLLGKNLKYNKATATFHQWRDQRQVYGLNFQSSDDAIVFSEGVLGAVECMNNPPQDCQPALQFNGADCYQDQQRYQDEQQQIQREQREQNWRRPPEPQVPQRNAQSPRVDTRAPAPDPPKPAVMSQSTIRVGIPTAPPVPPTPPISSGPPAPPAPPPVPAAPSPPAAPAPPPAPPLPPSIPQAPMPPAGGPPVPPPFGPPAVSGVPPAPPPPPMGAGPPPPPSGAGLASALAGVQLKKRSAEPPEDRRPPPQVNPMDDMMSALNKKLLARKKAAEGGSEENEQKPAPVVDESPKFQPPPVTNKTPASPFNNRSNSVKTSTTPAVNNKNTFPRTNSNTVSDDMNLRTLKEELIQVIRDEVQAAKEEIIEVLRQELRKSSS